MPIAGGLYLAQPWWLVLLVVPVGYLAGYLLLLPGRRLRLHLSYNPATLVRQPRGLAWLRYLPPLLVTATLVCWVVALARPQRQMPPERTQQQGIDILLLLDVSQSMQTADLPPNRLAVAKREATAFIEGRQYDRIGIVLFAQEAFSYAPLTLDYAYLKRSIAEVNDLILGKNGTAIGDAIGVGINRLQASPSPSQVMILITDGANRGGQLDPRSAAGLAAGQGIRIYTIAVGQDTYTYTDAAGRPQVATPDLDEPTLREIARRTGGQFYRSTDATSLNSIFRQISLLERTPSTATLPPVAEDVYFPFVLAGLLAAALYLGLVSLGLANLIEE